VQAVEMRALLRALDGATVLLSTHNLAEASALCSRIVILSRGRLVAEDTPAGLARRLEGVGRVLARVDGPAEAVARVLAAIPGVTAVEPGPADGEPGTLFVVRAPDPGAVQRRLAGAVVAAGWTLLEVRASAPTLEDLFVRLVEAAN
jgi:ABC-2 type transport system ATP-binding protein